MSGEIVQDGACAELQERVAAFPLAMDSGETLMDTVGAGMLTVTDTLADTSWPSPFAVRV